MRRESSSAEDYLETILILANEDFSARVTDIAAHLGIAKASVSQAIAQLREKGLVRQEPYGRVFLTPEGLERARSVKNRHTVLRKFLVQVLGVDEETAEHDACQMEHSVSPKTMERLVMFLEQSLSTQNNRQPE